MSKGKTVLELPPRKGNPRNSEGDFVTLKNGDILFAYTRFTGGSSDDARAVIAARVSRDQGKTWQARDRILIEPGQAQNVMSVSLLRMHNDRIALFYSIKKGFHDCRLHMITSVDEARTWSKPKRVINAPGYFVVNNDRVIQLASGRLIVPAAFHRRKNDSKTDWRTFDFRGIAMYFISYDQGKTWCEAKDWLALSQHSQSGLQEPGIIELLDGRLFSWARTDLGCQYGMFSADQGETWSQPFPTEFQSPCSALSIKRNPHNQNLVAVWNDHSGRYPLPAKNNLKYTWGRSPLVLATSANDGRTWENPIRLEADKQKGFCYTAIHFTADKHLLLAYCAGGKPTHPLDTLRIRRLSIC